jgi:hypothetical protein
MLWALPLLASSGPAAAERMADYMTMQVCTNAAGAVLPGVAPIDAACTARRPIRPGEPPPYVLRDFPPAGASCPAGSVIRYSVPVVRAGVTRIVSFDAHTPNGCSPVADATIKGLSVQWHDDAYGFIMGSWSPAGRSIYISPFCEQDAVPSHRFFRGWVIAPVELPPPCQPGYGAFLSRLAVGPAAGAATAAEQACPMVYHRAFHLWLLDRMAFKGVTLTAVIAHHYAQTDADGTSPGPAQQMERTYWTREFGLTRWEKWSREDWREPHSAPGDAEAGAARLGAALFAHGRCSAPYALPDSPTPAMRALPLETNGAWRQVIVDAHSGERHAWYLTLCEDYTNIGRSAPGAAALGDGPWFDDAFWRER